VEIVEIINIPHQNVMLKKDGANKKYNFDP